MPLKLPRIHHWLKGMKLGQWFKRQMRNISEDAKTLIPAAIAVTNQWKAFIDSPVADLVTALIPGNVDDAIKNKLREKLPAVLLKLQLAHAIAGIEDINEQLKAILDVLKLSGDDAKDRFYHEFCYTTIEVLSDGKLTMGEASILAQMYFDYEHQKAA
jgi:hypothetical protein